MDDIEFISELHYRVSNPAQGDYKRVLCVCTAGSLRSATAAVVLAGEPYNYNTRAAGSSNEFSLIPLSEALLLWAAEVVCMEYEHEEDVRWFCDKHEIPVPTVVTLGIPDSYDYRQKGLVNLIKKRYTEVIRGVDNG